jgi:NADPH:quinone reductase
MRAILMVNPGTADQLQLQEVARPAIVRDDQVLVRLVAAGVNPVDTKLRSRGSYYPDHLPTILGCDGAGVIEAIGSAVSGWHPGDRVYYCWGGIGGASGNYAEYNLVPAAQLAEAPANIELWQAAALPLAVITAWEGLFDRGHLKAGERVLIHGGAGGVGHLAIPLAKAHGAEVWTTVSNSTKAAIVRDLGADGVIRYDQGDWLEQLRHACIQGVDLVFDTIGGTTTHRSLHALAPYGRLVTLLQPDEGLDWKLIRMQNLTLTAELMLSPHYYGWPAALARQQQILLSYAKLLEQGRVSPPITTRLPLAAAAQAHRQIEAGGMIGKLILDCQP